MTVGTTLSGGVDSSTIVSLLRTFYDGEHQAFTAEFKGTEYDESVAAGHLASKLGLKHHRIASPSSDFLGTLTRIVHHMDGPTQCPATLPLWNIMRSMRGRIVVALEGQGADELIGGYYMQAPAAVFSTPFELVVGDRQDGIFNGLYARVARTVVRFVEGWS